MATSALLRANSGHRILASKIQVRRDLESLILSVEAGFPLGTLKPPLPLDQAARSLCFPLHPSGEGVGTRDQAAALAEIPRP